ncbi:hypothetical protein HYZ78_03545 [Candidatus Microgenomates bacterium]|nr:hypothetical protein [Candidatus Microgenomates bacterium]
MQKEKLINVDESGSAHFGIYIDPAADSPIFDVTQEDVDKMKSEMGITEPPMGSLLKLKDGGGDSNHATTRL